MQEQNHQAPFFTIIVIVMDLEHLLARTLDSIVFQTFQDFEILVIEAKEFHRIGHILQSYPEYSISLHSDFREGYGEVMAEALKKAKGKYVHFLLTGDTYLSKFHLKIVHDLIQKDSEPEFVYSAYLKKNPDENPSAICKKMSLTLLKKGEMPSVFQSIWLLRSAIDQYGGISPKYHQRAIFALVCDMVKQNAKMSYCPKVLTDYEVRTWSTKRIALFFWDTFQILKRKFGLKSTLFWWTSQDQIQVLKIVFRYLKKAFWEA